MHSGDAVSGSAHTAWHLACFADLSSAVDRNIPRSAIALKVIQRTVFLLDNLLGKFSENMHIYVKNSLPVLEGST